MDQYTKPSDKISTSIVLLTFFGFYLAAVVVVALICGSPGFLLILPVLFPAGLVYNQHLEILGMLSGYFVYIALFIAMLKYRSREICFSLVGILVIVLLLNIRGCVALRDSVSLPMG